jgi:hypothetical protein
MCVSAHCDLVPVLDVYLDHGGFLLDQVHDGQYDLENVLPRDLLPILEPLDHVLDELERHLLV